MAAQLNLLYDVPKNVDMGAIEAAINTLLEHSTDEIRSILKENGLPEEPAQAIAGQKITVGNKGAGLAAESVAVVVLLTPMVKALVPLLKPFSTTFAKVSGKVALDIWDMLKGKLWTEKHIRLQDRKSSTAKKNVKKASKPKDKN